MGLQRRIVPVWKTPADPINRISATTLLSFVYEHEYTSYLFVHVYTYNKGLIMVRIEISLHRRETMNKN